MSRDVPDKKFVVFMDSLGNDDVNEHTSWIKGNTFDGTMDAGNPYVTPKVLGEIYTGENPAVHGLPSVSRYGQANRTRPATITLPEIAAESPDVGNVASFGLPFIVPPQPQSEGDYWHLSKSMNQQSHYPEEARRMLTVPGPVGDLSDPEEDGGELLNHRVDTIRGTFQAARSLADSRDFEVMFVSCRILDSYVHYRYSEPEDAELTDRQMLLREVVDEEIADLARKGEVFVFGDHGGTEMTDVFKINRWLMDKGYLDVEIDREWREKAIEYGAAEEASEHGEVLSPGMAGVTVNEKDSIAISDDPFSTGVTILDGATEKDVRDLRADLSNTKYVDWVDVSRDLWDGPLIDEAPDLYPRRKVGVYVSGNLSEEMGGPEITRSGVHHPIGAWGSTVDTIHEGEEIEPTQLFDVILDFLDLEQPEAPANRRFGQTAPENQDEQVDESVRERLRDLGYM